MYCCSADLYTICGRGIFWEQAFFAWVSSHSLEGQGPAVQCMLQVPPDLSHMCQPLLMTG